MYSYHLVINLYYVINFSSFATAGLWRSTSHTPSASVFSSMKRGLSQIRNKLFKNVSFHCFTCLLLIAYDMLLFCSYPELQMNRSSWITFLYESVLKMCLLSSGNNDLHCMVEMIPSAHQQGWFHQSSGYAYSMHIRSLLFHSSFQTASHSSQCYR